MQTYIFKFRRIWFWKKYRVSGHRYEETFDKMVLYFPDGSVKELKHWKDCECHLGTDWVLAQKKNMEQQAGQAIPLNIQGG